MMHLGFAAMSSPAITLALGWQPSPPGLPLRADVDQREIVKPLNADELRSAIVNASSEEVEAMTLPGLHETIWAEREYLGWREPRAPLRGYIVHWVDGRPVGIVVKAASSRMAPGISAMCMLCRTPQPSSQVMMFTAPRAGQVGVDGNTVGTYICADLGCSIIIRITPPPSAVQPDPAEIVRDRAEGLLRRVRSFTANVMRDA